MPDPLLLPPLELHACNAGAVKPNLVNAPIRPAWRVRLAHHATCIEAGRSTDNFIDPKALPPLMRQDLREAFRAIAAAQKKLSVWVPSGI